MLAIALIVAGAIAAYWPGLANFAILDDQANLEPVWRWLAGELGWREVMFGNLSGPLGRPVSMASFLATAAMYGDSLAAFKAINLAIHLVCGLVLAAVVRSVARLDRDLEPHATWLPIVVAAVWVLHPLQVGTVLYVVQRMTLLSALFASLAVLAYLVGRRNLSEGRKRRGLWLIAAGVPVLTLMAGLAKENGLLVPLYCALVEWIYFRPARGSRRPLAGRALIALLPASVIAGFALLLARPPAIFETFSTLPFTLWERFLTQGPVLVDYAVAVLLPFLHAPSPFRDDYPLSTGLLSPPWTLVAWLLIAAVAAMAFRLRHTAPSVAFGVGWFLVGHSMESSFLPLHLHFEHRNYLPSIGLLVAMAVILVRLASVVDQRARLPRATVPALLTALLIGLAVSAHAHALTWRSPSALLAYTLQHYPDARSARLEAVGQALRQQPPRVDLAQSHYAHLLSLDDPNHRTIALLGLLEIECSMQRRVDPRLAAEVAAATPDVLEPEVVLHFRLVADALARVDCEGVSVSVLAARWSHVVAESGLEPGNPASITMRQAAALLHRRAGDLDAAMREARMAWDTGRAPVAVGLMLADFKLTAGRLDDAGALIATLDERVSRGDREGRAALGVLFHNLERARTDLQAPEADRGSIAPMNPP